MVSRSPHPVQHDPVLCGIDPTGIIICPGCIADPDSVDDYFRRRWPAAKYPGLHLIPADYHALRARQARRDRGEIAELQERLTQAEAAIRILAGRGKAP